MRLQLLLTIRFGSDTPNRVAAIESFAGDPGVDARAALNPLLASSVKVFDTRPEDVNIARMLTPGTDIEPGGRLSICWSMPARRGPIVPLAERKQALVANIEDGFVGGFSGGRTW